MPIGPVELGLIALIALALFGAGKLISVGGAVGKSIRDFRREISQRDGGPGAGQE